MVKLANSKMSLEEWYQNAKRTADGKKAGKGKQFDHIICPFTGDKLSADEAGNLYKGLWITYLTNHPDLIEYAKNFDGFHDIFKGKNTENGQADVIASYVKDANAFVTEVKRSAWYQNMTLKRKPLDHQIQSAKGRSTETRSPISQESIQIR